MELSKYNLHIGNLVYVDDLYVVIDMDSSGLILSPLGTVLDGGTYNLENSDNDLFCTYAMPKIELLGLSDWLFNRLFGSSFISRGRKCWESEDRNLQIIKEDVHHQSWESDQLDYYSIRIGDLTYSYRTYVSDFQNIYYLHKGFTPELFPLAINEMLYEIFGNTHV